jgi:hypothetical protein
LLLSRLSSLFSMPERIGLQKLLAKLCYYRTLCSFLRGQVVNCLQRSRIMLLSKLTTGTTKPPMRPEEVLPMGPCSVWFRTLSVLQAKHRCSLDGSAPWVAPLSSVVGRCASV